MNNRAWTAVTAIAVFCLAVIAVGDLVVPKPHNPDSAHQKNQDLRQLEAGVAAQKKDLDAAKATVARYL